jgi:excisionase family DNA binding protein
MDKAFYSTQEAAALLGVSRTTIQQMVELGQLRAWKTVGGHRRIDPESVRVLIASTTGPQAVAEPAAAYRILAADDDPGMRRLYEATVPTWGLPTEVRTVANGVDALLTVARWSPHLLILDLMMPEMDGFEVAQRLKENALTSGIDIIVATGASMNRELGERRLPGSVVVLQKPIPLDRLRTFVEAAVARMESFRRLAAMQG